MSGRVAMRSGVYSIYALMKMWTISHKGSLRKIGCNILRRNRIQFKVWMHLLNILRASRILCTY